MLPQAKSKILGHFYDIINAESLANAILAHLVRLCY